MDVTAAHKSKCARIILLILKFSDTSYAHTFAYIRRIPIHIFTQTQRHTLLFQTISRPNLKSAVLVSQEWNSDIGRSKGGF